MEPPPGQPPEDEASALGPLSRRARLGLAIHRGLDRRLSVLGVAVFRLTRGAIARPWAVDALLLTTTGRRSGKTRTVVLQYFPDGVDVIVVAANGGASTHPAWYHNLLAEPRATVEVGGRARAVRASPVDDATAGELWPRILRKAPDYERYLRATTRPLPLVRLSTTADVR
jgi:deazaflavin-dependent oxidoreductase (nitroreductase family)